MKGRARPKQAPDVVADAVLAAIAGGRLPAGAKLGEEELARLFGTSRTNVRAALRHLERVGVVTHIPNRGAFVARPTLEDAEHVYFARRLIEKEIVADVARHCTAADIRSLLRHIELQKAARQSGDRREHVRLLGDFHLLIASLAENRVLRELLGQLVPRTALLQTLYESDPGRSCAIEDHEHIVELLMQGDVDGCRDFIDRHLRTSETRLRIDTGPVRVALSEVFESGALAP